MSRCGTAVIAGGCWAWQVSWPCGVPLEAPEGRPDPVGPLLAGLSGGEQSVVTERAGHVREVLTGYRSGTAEAARPGEPRPDYDPARGSSP